MSNLQTYNLLENGEDPAAEPEELHSTVPFSKGRRHFPESLQSPKTYLHYADERAQNVQRRLPGWTRPVCSLWTCSLVFAAILIALVIALVAQGALQNSSIPEDVLQFIDPLIGTGPGGTTIQELCSRQWS